MRTRLLPVLQGALLAALVVALPSQARAHGIFGHMHVTGWAIENLPDGELKDFFSDPEVFNAALFGAAFTDSGYWQKDPAKEKAAHAYGEHTHWEPFIQDFVEWVLLNDPPPWDDYESRLRVAFLMGCASHGMQDEIFDSLFLHQVDTHDQGGQDVADPGTDGFLALDGHIRFAPDPYIPMDALLELYAVLPENVTEQVITDAVGIMTGVYVNDTVGPQVAASLGEAYEADLPWTRVHYLDPEVPGSIRAEVFPTLHYLEALWKRLHGELAADDVVIWTFPDPPRRLFGLDAGTPDPWVTFVYGVGVAVGSASTTWTADGDTPEQPGDAVAYKQKGTRWGAAWTRLHRLQPTASPLPATWYTVIWGPGAERIDGGETQAVALHFQSPCEGEGDPQCPDLGPLPVAIIDPPDAGGTDAGAGVDAGEDGGGLDGGGDGDGGDAGPGGDVAAGGDVTAGGDVVADAQGGDVVAAPDAGVDSKGGGDAWAWVDTSGAGALDTAVADVGGSPDSGQTEASSPDGDGCRAAGGSALPSALGSALLLLLALRSAVARRPTR